MDEEINDMEKSIIEILKKNYCYYDQIIEDRNSLIKIYNLFVNSKKFDSFDEIESYYIGKYYQFIERKNYEEMKKWYMISIEKGNSNAMKNLGLYYEEIEKNYEQMKKYCMMSIEKGNDLAMNNLGSYYYEVEKNYEQMKKYYMMAIEKGNLYSMYNLGFYHENIEKNYEQMKKYYMMSIEKGDTDAMNSLGIYYRNIEKNDDLMKKYLIMAIKAGDYENLNFLINYFKDNMNNDIYDEYFYEFISMKNKEVEVALPLFFKHFGKLFNEKIDLMNLHFEYTINGKGFTEAKADFLSRLK